jgi:c-di-GMP-related signal transduction protein
MSILASKAKSRTQVSASLRGRTLFQGFYFGEITVISVRAGVLALSTANRPMK